MTFIVTRNGISEASDVIDFVAIEDLGTAEGSALAVAVPNAASVDDLVPYLDRIVLLRLEFPAMGDGRAFSQAKRLRSLGYEGRLRGAGPVVSDQLRAAFRVGFDEIEVAEKVAVRQPPEHWNVRAQGSYQARVLA
jgi:phosphoadenosine phosphosulfate reductase